MTAIALIGCGTAGSIFNANDEATIIESRKSVQAWNRDSLAWLKELKSPSVTPEGLKADLAKMKADVANFSVEATKIEDPKLRSLMARLAKAYQGELTGYSKATSEISAGHGEAAANAMDQLFKANFTALAFFNPHNQGQIKAQCFKDFSGHGHLPFAAVNQHQIRHAQLQIRLA